MTRPSDGGEVPASEFTAQPGDVTDRTDLRDIVDLVIRARACAEDLGLDHPRVGDLTGVLAFDLDIALDHAVSWEWCRSRSECCPRSTGGPDHCAAPCPVGKSRRSRREPSPG